MHVKALERVGSAERLRAKEDIAPDLLGRAAVVDLVEPVAAGVHIMAPGNDAGLAEVVAEAAQIAQRKPRQSAGPRSGEGPGSAWLLNAEP